jgi:dihydrodipicolinate synthase/N-acetylneuraminate lyase
MPNPAKRLGDVYAAPITPRDAAGRLDAGELIGACPSIRGVKDSSGSLDLLRVLTRSLPDAVCLVGNDSALPQALREGICDGVISGRCRN